MWLKWGEMGMKRCTKKTQSQSFNNPFESFWISISNKRVVAAASPMARWWLIC